MANTLVYNEPTDTIRQMPQNYLVAHKINNIWTTHEIDLAVDKHLAIRVFLELLNFDSKYNPNGLQLLAKITPNKDFKI